MRKGFTIIELLVVVSIIGLLVAILLPAIGKARDSALLTQSQSNLRAIAQAAGIYGADFQDRQWTAVADDLGLPAYAGDCTKFSLKRCSAQLVLGFTTDGTSIGFFIPQAPTCGVQAPNANCNVAKAYWPCDFNLSGTGNFGSWRLVNAKSFNKYMGSRFYDPIFYAPKDKVTLEKASTMLEAGGDWVGLAGVPDIQSTVLSTYCWSPAAMWGPDVLSKKKGFQDPTKSPAGFRSPAASQAAFPDLKTRCMEHSWLQNKPNLDTMDGSKWGSGGANPDSFSPAVRGTGGMPWFFNQGYQSTPGTVFFDGHIAQLGVPEAVDCYNRTVKADSLVTGVVPKIKGSFASGSDITGMTNGYSFGAFDNGAYFDGKYVSYHVLTADGILGRDTIGQK
ncbi:MAG: prepilin-type N-terminal cleavage/methylation domain-containing protein [Planctomycetes bacterium]|nr:prepilin-type N-terminal cleavage/methylation domain-containing protein [Planctomycetota bacterium]